ncbi:hypothetical protein [Streptomyces sp. NPDC006552]|uniref:hypothetical protein n=1 Tax=Streptomyces sp. NPDC006552 TaxID=3157179 RepID=UPI0033BCB901
MASLVEVTAVLAQDNRPDGPPWLKWVFLAFVVVNAPWVLYKLHQHGYFKKRR